MAAELNVSWSSVGMAVEKVRARHEQCEHGAVLGIPRGGIVPAVMVAQRLGLPVVETLTERSDGSDVLVVDDLVDSGRTAAPYVSLHAFDALYRKPHSPPGFADGAVLVDAWVVFPWERAAAETPATDAVVRLLEAIGEDPTRDGLRDTPARYVRALVEMTAGRDVDLGALLSRTFEDDRYDEMVVVSGVEFTSLCEHHLLPFTGTADLGYIPAGGRVVGLSKLARLVEACAQRVQIQERMTAQIADALNEHLSPVGVGVIVRATHTCMACRGVRKRAEMVTSAMLGALRDKPAARAEFVALLDR